MSPGAPGISGWAMGSGVIGLAWGGMKRGQVTCVKVRGQLVDIGSLLPRGSQ